MEKSVNEARRAPPGELYDVLVKAFPEHRTVQGLFDIPRLAKDIGVSHETIYRAVRADKLSVKVATKIIQLSESLVALLEIDDELVLEKEDLFKFVLK